MVDNVSKNRRSQIMRLVKSKNTKIEIQFRNALKKLCYKFRKNVSNYFGKPDIVLSKFKTVIFIDSCFWHGCVKHCRMPSSRKKYWIDKIERNKKRDKEVKRYYKTKSWKVLRIWEHDMKSLDKLIQKINFMKDNKIKEQLRIKGKSEKTDGKKYLGMKNAFVAMPFSDNISQNLYQFDLVYCPKMEYR